MRKKMKIDIKFGVLKFKEIRQRLESVSLGKCKSFMQKDVTKWKKNQTWKFTKMLNSVMKEQTWKKTPLEDSRKSSEKSSGV